MIKKLAKGILLLLFVMLALIVFLPALLSFVFDIVIVFIVIGVIYLIAWLCGK